MMMTISYFDLNDAANFVEYLKGMKREQENEWKSTRSVSILHTVHVPSSVMLKKLSLDGIDSDVVLDAELTAACNDQWCVKMCRAKWIENFD